MAFDAASRSSFVSVNEVVWNHTNQGNAIAVGVAYFTSGDTTFQSTTVTYAGSSFSLVSSRVSVPTASPGSFGSQGDLWYRGSPSTGLSTVTVTLTGVSDGLAIAASYTLVSTQNGYAAATGTSSQASVNVVSQTGDQVVDFVFIPASTTASTVGAGQTQRESGAIDGSFLRASWSDEAGAASVTMSHGFPSNAWGQMAINLVAVGGAPAVMRRTSLPLLGVS